MFKRLVIYLSFVLILSLLLVACGGDDEEATSVPETVTEEESVDEPDTVADCFTDVEDGATIVFSGWGYETEQEIYRDSIDRFATACPAVTVDYQPIPADFQTKLKAAMAGGTAPVSAISSTEIVK